MVTTRWWLKAFKFAFNGYWFQRKTPTRSWNFPKLCFERYFLRGQQPRIDFEQGTPKVHPIQSRSVVHDDQCRLVAGNWVTSYSESGAKQVVHETLHVKDNRNGNKHTALTLESIIYLCFSAKTCGNLIRFCMSIEVNAYCNMLENYSVLLHQIFE